MSAAAVPQEVAKDGVVRIPKSVFVTAPAPAPAAAASSSDSAPPAQAEGKVTQVRRLDGSIEEVVTGLPPQNPAFQPRKCHPGGKIVTNDKLEVLLKFYERKGKPLTPELEAKKAELEAAGKAESDALAKRAAKFGTGGGGGGGGKKAKKGGGASTSSSSGGAAKAAAAVVLPPAPKVDAETKSWFKNRPKGGVKVLGGVEGVVTAGANKRPREDGAAE